MPQLNPEFFVSQLFWLAVFFSLLFIILWRISLPRIASVLEKRQRKIDDDLSTAKELQEQAVAIEKNINDQISKAKQISEDKIKKTINELQEEVNSQLSQVDAELEEKIIKAEKEISKNKDDQMKNINDEIANITKITVSKISDLEIKDSDINIAIKSAESRLN